MRELVLGNTRFNDIARGLPGISRSLLTQRLRHLEKRGVVERWPAATGQGSEYRLTPAGRDLERIIDAFGRWAIEWLFDDLYPHEVHPHTLMWWMHRRTDPAEFPDQRTVVRVRLHRAGPDDRLAGARAAARCRSATSTRASTATWCCAARPAAYSDVFNGAATWAQAVRAGAIEVSGPPGWCARCRPGSSGARGPR